jgi:hypothetical protein
VLPSFVACSGSIASCFQGEAIVEWWKLLLASVAAFAATSVLAHDDAYLDTLKAPYGGQLRMAGPNHYELVVVKNSKSVRENPIIVYVTDHAQNSIDVQGAKGSAKMEAGQLKATSTLYPDGGNRLRGFAKYASTPGMTVEVTITLPGKEAETARFTPLGKAAR